MTTGACTKIPGQLADWREMARDAIDRAQAKLDAGVLTSDRRAIVSSSARAAWVAALDREGSAPALRTAAELRKANHYTAVIDKAIKTRCRWQHLGYNIAMALILATCSGDTGLEEEARGKFGEIVETVRFNNSEKAVI
jgi:hypothetical protein